MSRYLPPARRALAILSATALVSFGTLSASAPAQAAVTDPGLVVKLNSVLRDSRVTRARSAAIVLDAQSGSILYSRYGDRATMPASNTKIVTALAAMDTLGSGYRFKTEVIRRGALTNGLVNGRLYLKGYGDPTTRQSDYAALARQVYRAGVRRIKTDLIVDATYFDADRYNATWKTSYAASYYAAEVSGLTVAANADLDPGTVYLRYSPGARGQRAKISFSPAAAGRYITVTNNTTTSARGSGSTLSARRSHGSNTITVSGRVAVGRSTAQRLITVHRPELYAGAVFRAELARLNITVGGTVRALPTPATKRTVVARDTSMPLSQLIVPFMKYSNNGHAEALTKAMGAKRGSGSWAAGLTSTRDYLVQARAWNTEIRLADGSGLTRANRLTPRALARALVHAQSKTWFPAFRYSLPVAGNRTRSIGGTLRNRMNGTSAANNARAKTGTLTGVTALSGYVRGKGGRLYAFSMLSEHGGNSPRPVENALVVALANHRP